MPPKAGSLFIGALQQVINLRPGGGEQHVSFKPALDHHIRQLTPGQQAVQLMNAPTFEDWWTAVLVRDIGQRQFIVKTVANKDGGGPTSTPGCPTITWPCLAEPASGSQCGSTTAKITTRATPYQPYYDRSHGN